ncbi:hypothetical protein Tco_0030067 [Tanacetum coccineum]
MRGSTIRFIREMERPVCPMLLGTLRFFVRGQVRITSETVMGTVFDRQLSVAIREGMIRRGQKGYPDYASSPPCDTCGKLHPGKACHRVTGAYFTCGLTGHIA